MAKERVGIYGIKNKISGKYYVGKSVDVHKRLKDHGKRLKGGYHFNQKLQRAWAKYGGLNFEFMVLEHCQRDELNNKETSWIKKLDSRINGFNMTDGGDGSQGRKQSKETKEKLRNAFLGKPGRKHTEEHKEYMSKIMAGENNPMYGKKLHPQSRNKISVALKKRYKHQPHHAIGAKATLETRKKMSIAHSGERNHFYGKKHSEKSCQKMSKTRMTMYKGGDNPRARKVICGGIQFGTMKECARHLGVCRTSIHNWLHGKNKMPKEYEHLKIRFAKDDAKCMTRQKQTE